MPLPTTANGSQQQRIVFLQCVNLFLPPKNNIMVFRKQSAMQPPDIGLINRISQRGPGKTGNSNTVVLFVQVAFIQLAFVQVVVFVQHNKKRGATI
jgi:hypothetical protein